MIPAKQCISQTLPWCSLRPPPLSATCSFLTRRTTQALRPKAFQNRRDAIKASLSTSAASEKRLVPVRAEHRITVPVTAAHDAGAQLSTYMALPVSQFVLVDVPLGAELRRVGADLFELLVPRLEFFGLWVQPRILCTVRNSPREVDIRSIKLKIEGSDIVHSLRLTERVDFHVHCCFTHNEGPKPAIHSKSIVTALVDPPVPFSYIPDSVLSGTANAVITASLAALQRTFVGSLAADYKRWASSPVYREERRQHAARSDAALKTYARGV